MLRVRTLAICACALAVVPHGLHAQELAQYRNFALGSDLATVSARAGVAASEARTIHERPAVLQDLEWRPARWIGGATSASTDPVEHVLFSFYNNQLFQIVVDYNNERTEGMTKADIIEALSEVYGVPVKRTAGAGRAASRVEVEAGSPVARWGDAQSPIVLYQTSSYRETFRLIVTAVALDDLADKAQVRAARLDEQEAPQREVAREKKERDDRRAVAEKARSANKAAFRP
jgi:hypothetical protein